MQESLEKVSDFRFCQRDRFSGIFAVMQIKLAKKVFYVISYENESFWYWQTGC